MGYIFFSWKEVFSTGYVYMLTVEIKKNKTKKKKNIIYYFTILRSHL